VEKKNLSNYSRVTNPRATSDYPNHKAIQEKAQQYLRWRNKNANDKRLLKAQNTVLVM